MDSVIFGDYSTYGESVCDEDECDVMCPSSQCDCDIWFKDGQYYCPSCGTIFSRRQFFDYIGAEGLNVECEDCSENYPVCKFWGRCYIL